MTRPEKPTTHQEEGDRSPQQRLLRYCRTGSLEDLQRLARSSSASANLDWTLALFHVMWNRVDVVRYSVIPKDDDAVAQAAAERYRLVSDELARRGFVSQRWAVRGEEPDNEDDALFDKAVYLTNHGVDLSAIGGGGGTVLHWAVALDLPRLVRHLLTKPDVRVNAPDDRGNTPLHFAVGNRSLVNTKALMEHPQTNINVRNYLKKEQMIHRRKLPLMGQLWPAELAGDSPFHMALQHGHWDMVRLLLEDGRVVDLSQPDQWGNTPVNLAVQMGSVKLVQEFVTQQPRVDCNRPNFMHRAPLHHLFSHHNLSAQRLAMAHILLNHEGVDVNMPDDRGDPVLFLAMRRHDWELVDCCLRHPRIQLLGVVNKIGESALHVAIRQERLSLVQDLVQREPGLLRMRDNDQETPLHFAVGPFCKRNQKGMILNFLLEQTATEVNAQDCHGDTALHMACGTRRCEMVEPFLRHPKIQLSLTNDNGETAVDIANSATTEICNQLHWMELILLSRSIEQILLQLALPPDHLQQSTGRFNLQTEKEQTEAEAVDRATKTLQVLMDWLPHNWQNYKKEEVRTLKEKGVQRDEMRVDYSGQRFFSHRPKLQATRGFARGGEVLLRKI